jgi:hypothetical protein
LEHIEKDRQEACCPRCRSMIPRLPNHGACLYRVRADLADPTSSTSTASLPSDTAARVRLHRHMGSGPKTSTKALASAPSTEGEQISPSHVPDYSLYTCIHCQRVAIEEPIENVLFYFKLPHTREEAQIAAEQGCPLFAPSFEDPPLPEEPSCSHWELARTVLRLRHLLWQARHCESTRDRAGF